MKRSDEVFTVFVCFLLIQDFSYDIIMDKLVDICGKRIIVT